MASCCTSPPQRQKQGASPPQSTPPQSTPPQSTPPQSTPHHVLLLTHTHTPITHHTVLFSLTHTHTHTHTHTYQTPAPSRGPFCGHGVCLSRQRTSTHGLDPHPSSSAVTHHIELPIAIAKTLMTSSMAKMVRRMCSSSSNLPFSTPRLEGLLFWLPRVCSHYRRLPNVESWYSGTGPATWSSSSHESSDCDVSHTSIRSSIILSTCMKKVSRNL
jgi:hypothetical protein